VTSGASPSLRRIVEAAIHEVAPEVDLDRLPGDLDLREVAGIDSLDFVQLMEALQRRTGTKIVDHDYPRLATVDGCISYLGERRNYLSSDDAGDDRTAPR
jgi:acyl carrier protein